MSESGRFQLIHIHKVKDSIFRNRFRLIKIRLQVLAGFIFEITTFNEEKVKDFL